MICSRFAKLALGAVVALSFGVAAFARLARAATGEERCLVDYSSVIPASWNNQTVSAVTGADSGGAYTDANTAVVNLTGSLTVNNGGIFVFNQINLAAGAVINKSAGGQLRKGKLYSVDVDGDGYVQTGFVAAPTPGVTVRRYQDPSQPNRYDDNDNSASAYNATCAAATSSYGACSYASTCINTGSRSGTCTDAQVTICGACPVPTGYACSDTAGCDRNTNGIACTGGYCSSGSCRTNNCWAISGSCDAGCLSSGIAAASYYDCNRGFDVLCYDPDAAACNGSGTGSCYKSGGVTIGTIYPNCLNPATCSSCNGSLTCYEPVQCTWKP